MGIDINFLNDRKENFNEGDKGGGIGKKLENLILIKSNLMSWNFYSNNNLCAIALITFIIKIYLVRE